MKVLSTHRQIYEKVSETLLRQNIELVIGKIFVSKYQGHSGPLYVPKWIICLSGANEMWIFCH